MRAAIILVIFFSGMVNAEINQVWSNVYQGVDRSIDQALAMTVDDSSNVYVTGHTGLFQKNDFLTIKYDSAGNQIWSAEHAGTQNAVDQAIAIDIDPNGDIVVLGSSHNQNTGFDITLLKYNSDGQLLWHKDFHQSTYDFAANMKINSNGEIVVLGSTFNSFFTRFG